MSDMKMAMKAAARSISAMHHPIYPKSASCLPRKMKWKASLVITSVTNRMLKSMETLK